MGKFNFRLDKVLEYREKVEDINKSEYGKAKKRLDDETTMLQNIISHKDSVNSERDKLAKGTTINSLKNYNIYLKSIRNELVNQVEVVEKARTTADTTRDKLINSSKDKKVLEKLKDRDFKNHLYLLKKEEEEIIDQIVSYKSSVK